MPIIKPTVGRVVHYHPDPLEPVARNPSQPHAAIITNVWSDACVNLVVFDSNGVPYSKTLVILLQPNMNQTGFGFAEWMPYQKGQAAKTEQLEQELKLGKTVVEPEASRDEAEDANNSQATA